jgi:flagellar M-ring protein FliF
MADTKEIIANLARSGRMRIAAALVVTALVGGGLGVIMLRGETGDKALLYSGLDLKEAAEMTGKLDTAGIKYDLQGGGSAIFVERSRVEDARMMLSEQNLPTRGSVGWEIFDKTDALGQTSFVQNINKVRALEGELARDISSLKMVKSARVRLNLPDKPLFDKDAHPPSASEKVRAVRNLIATAVPGMTVDHITVVDDQGRMLAAGAESDANGLGGAASDERQVAMEDSYRKKILEIVQNIAGPDAARVTVSLDVDFNKVTQSAETFDPDTKVLLSSSTVADSEKNQTNEPGDTTTIANNVPAGTAPATPAPAKPTNQSEKTHSEETVNYKISSNTRTEIIEGGRIKRLSVAVAVDNLRVPSPDGKSPPTWKPRSADELKKIEALVKSAVGFDEKRGDAITVDNVPFAHPEIALLDAEKKPGPFDFNKFDLVHIAEIGALLITALALVLLVLRPLVKGLFGRGDGQGGDSLTGPDGINLRLTAEQAQQLANVGQGGSAGGVTFADAKSVPIDIPAADRLDAGIDVARISGQVKASSIKKISEVVASHPEESLAIIRSWLAEEGGERAA